MRLEGQTAIVTGAGVGIGKAIVERLATEGAKVVVAEKNEETGRAEADAIARAGGTVIFVPCDVSEEADVRRMVEATRQKFGDPDILVNNAGIAGPVEKVIDLDLEKWRGTTAINIDGVFLCCKHVLPHMIRNRRGSIINISSVTGKRPLPLRSPYATSKMAVIGFTRTLAAEVGEWGIRVNAVCPGYVTGERQKLVIQGIMKSTGKSLQEVTAMQVESAALKCYVEPEEVAALVAFLATSESAKMTGQDINVSAGSVMY